MVQGTIVSLDRGYPLARLEDGTLVRCEHATALVKSAGTRAVIGDSVEIDIPEDHDKAIVVAIGERRTALVRRDPAERTASQTLAANFDLVIIAEPIAELNYNRLERALVLAHQTGADVAVVLTKSDLAASEDALDNTLNTVRDLAGSSVAVLAVSADDSTSIEQVRALLAPDKMAVLVGKSGVGKSSLVNLLVGKEVQATGSVRASDGKGRHTTVSRTLVDVPGGGSLIDMPGLRGLGLWEADLGLDAAFSDIATLAEQCRFRDCKHADEPGCAVRAAVEAGQLAEARLASYRRFLDECERLAKRREDAAHMRGEKASDRKKARSFALQKKAISAFKAQRQKRH